MLGVMDDSSSRALALSGAGLVALAALGALLLGIYHVTHQGYVSGTIEPVASAVLVGGLVLVRKARRALASGIEGSADRQFRWGMLMIASIDVTVLVFSVYHAATQGNKSAILELFYATLLTAAMFLFHRSMKSLRQAS